MSMIDIQFAVFHEAHPELYKEFVKRTFALINRGKTHYSADAILHIVRYHSEVDGRNMEEYKINNNYSSRYARLFIKDHPAHEDFFKTRKINKKDFQSQTTPRQLWS